jgi:large subunit ribosomal protein L21
MAYAIVKLGGKQYRVREGERLTVDRLPHAENATFEPDVLLVGGDGKADLAPSNVTVTARIVEHGRGPKIRIGKYRPKNGYKKHTGFRASLTRIEIEAIGSAKAEPKAAAAKPKTEPKPKATAKPKPEPAATPAQVAGAVLAPAWDLLTLEAALAYEGEHGKRKGATAALESAIASKEEGS